MVMSHKHNDIVATSNLVPSPNSWISILEGANAVQVSRAVDSRVAVPNVQACQLAEETAQRLSVAHGNLVSSQTLPFGADS